MLKYLILKVIFKNINFQKAEDLNQNITVSWKELYTHTKHEKLQKTNQNNTHKRKKKCSQ